MSLDKAPASGELLGMSDEDFMNLDTPPVTEDEDNKDADEGGAQDEDQDSPDAAADDEAGEDNSDDEADKAGVSKADAGEEDESGKADDEVDEKPDEATANEDQNKNKVKAKAKSETEAEAEASASKDADTKDLDGKKPSPAGSNEGGVPEPTGDQALAFYKQVMAPFKANGKMIQLKDPSEVIQLMQMGANYTRKLQDIQPHRKVLLMLQNNDLLDEGKLSYLIDLDKKNPEAIKKLIKDAGIDPMDIDTSTEPAYSEGNHRVSDEEATFRHTLDELASTQEGKETVQLINTDWDQASKEALWQSPEIMSIIHQQRENGIYDLITTEMDRQKTLGQIPPNTPFLQAYKTVGDQLAAAGSFDDQGGEQQGASTTGNPSPGPVAVATRKAAPKSTLANGDKASAAAPTRTTPRKAEKLVNPLAMSDDEFLSHMANRL